MQKVCLMHCELYKTMSRLHLPLDPSFTEHFIGHASGNAPLASPSEVTGEVEFWLFQHKGVLIFLFCGSEIKVRDQVLKQLQSQLLYLSKSSKLLLLSLLMYQLRDKQGILDS